MTDLSQGNLPSRRNPLGYLQTQGSPVPPAISAALCLKGGYGWDGTGELRALSVAKRDGYLDQLEALAEAAAEALEPVDHKRLIDRLTLLGMTMLHGKAEDQITAWLHETTRLLESEGLPEAVLFNAIDECVKEPGRRWCPTVGEILDKVSEPLQTACREAANLRRLADLVAEGVAIPDWEPLPYQAPVVEKPKEYVTPEEARQILREHGLLGTRCGEAVENLMVNGNLPDSKPKSRADYIREGKVPPPIVPPEYEPIRV